jgi:hypothetical protein
MVEELTKCPKCKRRTLTRQGQELVCSECGGHFPAPQEDPSSSSSSSSPKRAHILERHQFYEKNKKEIIRDYEAKGRQETAEKWKIPWPNLYQLLRRWGIIKTPADAKAAHEGSKHAYYERNKQEIIKDLLAVGRLPTRKKWKISSSTLFTLEKRWLTADQKATLDNITFSPIRKAILDMTQGNNGLPQFPEFSNDWGPEVQLKWLDLYGQLVAQKQIAGGDRK